MSETTNETKQFLDKIGLDALWNKICSIFASKQELEDVRNEIPTLVQSDWNENTPVLSSYIKGRTHSIGYSPNEISSVGRYNLDDYGAIYPVIICFGDSVYEVREGENQLSFGPPLLVNLEGNTLTIDGSSYVNENCKIKIATRIQKLNPIFIPDLPDSSRVTIEYSNGTLSMSNVNEIDYNEGTLNLTL